MVVYNSNNGFDTSFTFNNVDKMSDDEFKECIAKLFLSRYKTGKSMSAHCNVLHADTIVGKDVDIELSVRF